MVQQSQVFATVRLRTQRPARAAIASRRAIQVVALKITMAPAKVQTGGTSLQIRKPSTEAQTSSRKRAGWVAAMSVALSERLSA